MFKAEINKPEEKLLQCRFEACDYPLVNFQFSRTSYKREHITALGKTGTSELKMDEKFLLDIVVSEAFISKISGQASEKLAQKWHTSVHSEHLSTSMKNTIWDILNCSFKDELKNAYLTMKVAELLIQILSAKAPENTLSNWSEQDRKSFKKVRDLLSKDLKANYSIETLAVEAGMNRSKLQQGFKDLFSKTIYTFLFDLKMSEAKSLLTRNTSLSLKEVAAMVGYSHVNHFSVAFKKKFGVSPSYFKKLLDCILPLVLFLS